MKIALDIGGVISKFPDVFRELVRVIGHTNAFVELHVISDMHDVEKMRLMLWDNGFLFPASHIHSADYVTHGELCKSVLCEQLGIDIMVDDFPGYVAHGKHVRLLVMPDPHEPYFHDSWKTDGGEGDFGRRRSGHRIPPSANSIPNIGSIIKGDHQ